MSNLNRFTNEIAPKQTAVTTNVKRDSLGMMDDEDNDDILNDIFAQQRQSVVSQQPVTVTVAAPSL